MIIGGPQDRGLSLVNRSEIRIFAQTTSTQPDLLPKYGINVSDCERRTQALVVPPIWRCAPGARDTRISPNPLRQPLTSRRFGSSRLVRPRGRPGGERGKVEDLLRCGESGEQF